MKKTLLCLCLLASASINAKSVAIHVYQCGGFRFELIAESMAKVNGEFVTSQKVAALGEHGMKSEMTLMPASDGNNYGFEYIHPDGSDKRWLNVELIRTSLDQTRIIGSFDCYKVKG